MVRDKLAGNYEFLRREENVNTSKPRRLSTQILRWTARLLGTLLVLFVVVMMVGEGVPKPSILTGSERLMFAPLSAMLLGLILAWRWEGIGGALALSGYFLCGVLGPRLTSSPFMAGGAAGCLYLLAWWTSDRSKWRECGGPRRLGITAAVLAGTGLIIWIWLGVGARSLKTRVSNLPNLAGHWVGTGFVSDALVYNRKIDLDITVVPNGTFQGVLGDATIVEGHVKSNLTASRRGYLLSRMGEPTYTMSLELSGPPLATPRKPRPHADLCFELQGGQMVGALHLPDLPMDLRDLHVVLHRKDA